MAPVDAEGRFALPGFIRAAIGHAADTTILVGAHEADPCLCGFEQSYVPLLAIETERRRLREQAVGETPAAHFSRVRRAFGLIEEAVGDEEGRVRLSEWMRQRAMIEDRILIVGTGATFELWNPLLAAGSADPGLRELAAWQLAAHSKPE